MVAGSQNNYCLIASAFEHLQNQFSVVSGYYLLLGQMRFTSGNQGCRDVRTEGWQRDFDELYEMGMIKVGPVFSMLLQRLM